MVVLGLRESFEPPLLGPVLGPFSGRDRAQSSPKTELGGHRGAGRRLLENLHGASAGNTFLPSLGGRKRPKTGIRRALGRLQARPRPGLERPRRFGAQAGDVAPPPTVHPPPPGTPPGQSRGPLEGGKQGGNLSHKPFDPPRRVGGFVEFLVWQNRLFVNRLFGNRRIGFPMAFV